MRDVNVRATTVRVRLVDAETAAIQFRTAQGRRLVVRIPRDELPDLARQISLIPD